MCWLIQLFIFSKSIDFMFIIFPIVLQGNWLRIVGSGFNLFMSGFWVWLMLMSSLPSQGWFYYHGDRAVHPSAYMVNFHPGSAVLLCRQIHKVIFLFLFDWVSVWNVYILRANCSFKISRLKGDLYDHFCIVHTIM